MSTVSCAVPLAIIVLLPDKSARPHIPEGRHSFRTPLPLHTLHDGGQTCRVGGHIGRCAKRGRGRWRRRQSKEVERLRVEPGDPGRRESREWCRSEWAMLGSEEGSGWTVEASPNLSVNEALFHHPRPPLLPPTFWLIGFGVLHPRCWSFCQFPPRRNLKACILNQSATPLDTLETSDGPHLQLCDHCLRNVRVSVVHHAQRIGPAGPMGTFPVGAAQPQSSHRELKLASTLAMPGAEWEPRMVSRHVHTLASCCSAKASLKSGCTDLNQKFARVDAHMRRSNHAD